MSDEQEPAEVTTTLGIGIDELKKLVVLQVTVEGVALDKPVRIRLGYTVEEATALSMTLIRTADQVQAMREGKIVVAGQDVASRLKLRRR